MQRRTIPAVGIDLGTTFSVVAVLNESGNPRTLVNTEGDKLTPSAVLFEPTGIVVGKGNAGHEAADGVAAEARGGVPARGLSACRAGDRGNQPDPAGLGELLPDWERGAVLRAREGLGREEGAAPHDAGEGPPGLRLEPVE